jgi:ribonuclease HII
MLIGVDEVGRGCLAGPVVACAFRFKFDPDKVKDLLKELEQRKGLKLTDSKLISAAKRQRWAEILPELGEFAIAESSVSEIDEVNILQASLLAMRRAVEKLMNSSGIGGKLESLETASPKKGDKDNADFLVLVDGNQKIPGLPVSVRQKTVVGGDSKIFEISAASILAKVYRDQLMSRISEEFPFFGWEKNKGYGSKDHLLAIQSHGVTSWHRKSFAGVKGIRAFGESKLP